MKLGDYYTIYGDTDITEPVVRELIRAPSLQRLKRIGTGGYRKSFYKRYPDLSRYDHSLGVYFLLKRFGAPLKEQIAGLIHDVSHSAFSHSIDYVLEVGSQKKQDHQDNVHEAFVRKSEIPAILEQYGIDMEYLMNDAHFPLKERELPDLCADRIDYLLQESILAGELKREQARQFLAQLRAEDGTWFFTDCVAAKSFTDLFSTMNTDYWASYMSAVMFRTLGDYLLHALQNRYINEVDLYTDDATVLARVKPYLEHDERLQQLKERLENTIPTSNDPDNYHAHVFLKSRAIDPWCLHEGARKRVSDIDPDWQKRLQDELRPKEYFIRFED